MIFSVGDHIKQIIVGEKTQTRRASSYYKINRTYSIQPGRTKPGIPEGRILITDKRTEYFWRDKPISQEDAQAEGGYTPRQFEKLYRGMDQSWNVRYAYTFRFIPIEEAED